MKLKSLLPAKYNLNEKLVLKKYSPKNLLVVVSDKGDYKQRSAETYKAKDVLKKAGFKWTKLYDENNKEVAVWAIDASKIDTAREVINSINKEQPTSSSMEQFEELVFDLSTVTKRSGLDDRIVSFLEKLKTEVDTARASDEFQRYINFKKKFRNYSFSNTMLIWIQKPNATRVAGYKKWQELGRQVKKGAVAISIFVPIVKKQKQDDTSLVSAEKELDKQVERKVITGFTTGNVFDISDTESIPGVEDRVVNDPEWHAGNEPNETAEKISEYVEDIIKTIELKYTQSQGDGEQGYAMGGDHINLSSGVAGANKASTLVHELAHILMHFPNSLFKDDELGKISRNVKEYQAEAVAAAVMDEYGLPYKHSNTYIALWNQNIGELKQYTDMITKAAGWIIDNIDKRAEESK